MRIKRAEVLKVSFPLKHPFWTALGETIMARTLHIQLWVDNGLCEMGRRIF